MRVLVLNGSPKKGNSDTIKMTKAFLEGMKDKGEQDITIIDVIDKHIEFCNGCFNCMLNGGNCIHDDDMREILERILESDLLIWSFPLYCYGMPAPLKNLLDRTLPLSSLAMQKVNGRYEHVAQSDFSHLRYIMICGCGFPNSKMNFEPAVRQFELCFPCNHTIITVPESPMFSAKEADIVTLPKLEEIRRAGREYAEKQMVSPSLIDEIKKPMILEEQYAAIVNGSVGK
ncbi:MAG: flavodoxin family protein [Sphaerochaetaceae bacterium]|nr:flavodoxin family protein [Sphaerochaetaceae bacterium]